MNEILVKHLRRKHDGVSEDDYGMTRWTVDQVTDDLPPYAVQFESDMPSLPAPNVQTWLDEHA